MRSSRNSSSFANLLWYSALLLNSLSLIPLSNSPAVADLKPALRLAEAFQLGISCYAPNAAVLKLDTIIKTDKTGVDALAQAAEDTRKTELISYHNTVTILNTMRAPDFIITPFTSAVYTLTQPLVISDNAKQQVPSDPSGQKIWATLDEAEQLAPEDNGELTAWLKLSHGRDALWAYHLGNIVAVIRAKIPGKPSEFPLVLGAGALAQTAPAGTPDSLTTALTTLGDESKHHRIDDQSLQALDTAATAVFGTASNPAPLS